jgi:hypothetical protein
MNSNEPGDSNWISDPDGIGTQLGTIMVALVRPKTNLTLVTGTTAAVSFTAPTPTNCTLETVWQGDASNIIFSLPASTTQNLVFGFVVNITAANATLTFSVAGTMPTAPTSAELWIAQIAPIIQ